GARLDQPGSLWRPPGPGSPDPRPTSGRYSQATGRPILHLTAIFLWFAAILGARRKPDGSGCRSRLRGVEPPRNDRWWKTESRPDYDKSWILDPRSSIFHPHSSIAGLPCLLSSQYAARLRS